MNSIFFKTLFYRYLKALSSMLSRFIPLVLMIGCVADIVGHMFAPKLIIEYLKDPSQGVHGWKLIGSLILTGLDVMVLFVGPLVYILLCAKSRQMLNSDGLEKALQKIKFPMPGILGLIGPFGFIIAYFVCISMVVLVWFSKCLLRIPQTLLKWVKTYPERAQIKNQKYLDENPEMAAKIFGGHLHEALPKSEKTPFKERL